MHTGRNRRQGSGISPKPPLVVDPVPPAPQALDHDPEFLFCREASLRDRVE